MLDVFNFSSQLVRKIIPCRSRLSVRAVCPCWAGCRHTQQTVGRGWDVGSCHCGDVPHPHLWMSPEEGDIPQAEAVSREDQRDNGTWHWDWCPSKGRREGALAGSWCLASLVMDPSKAWRGPEHSPSCSHSLGGKASPCSSFPGLPILPWLWLLQGGSSELPLGWEDVPPSQWDVQVSVCHSC